MSFLQRNSSYVTNPAVELTIFSAVDKRISAVLFIILYRIGVETPHLAEKCVIVTPDKSKKLFKSIIFTMLHHFFCIFCYFLVATKYTIMLCYDHKRQNDCCQQKDVYMYKTIDDVEQDSYPMVYLNDFFRKQYEKAYESALGSIIFSFKCDIKTAESMGILIKRCLTEGLDEIDFILTKLDLTYLELHALTHNYDKFCEEWIVNDTRGDN